MTKPFPAVIKSVGQCKWYQFKAAEDSRTPPKAFGAIATSCAQLTPPGFGVRLLGACDIPILFIGTAALGCCDMPDSLRRTRISLFVLTF